MPYLERCRTFRAWACHYRAIYEVRDFGLQCLLVVLESLSGVLGEDLFEGATSPFSLLPCYYRAHV
jgi:hypothetical protein